MVVNKVCYDLFVAVAGRLAHLGTPKIAQLFAQFLTVDFTPSRGKF